MSIRIISAVFKTRFGDLKDGEDHTTKASTVKLVLLALADHASDDGSGAYPSLTRLEHRTELSRQTIVDVLDALKFNGLIALVGRSKLNTCHYTILIDAFPVTTGDGQVTLPASVKPLDQGSQVTLPAPVKPLDQGSQVTLPAPVKPLDQGSQVTLPALVKPLDLNRPLTTLQPITEEEEERAQHLKALHFANFGIVSPLLYETFRKAARAYPNRGWYAPAFTVAVQNGARSWRYVETVLHGWSVNGFGWRPEYTRRTRPAPRERSAASILMDMLKND